MTRRTLTCGPCAHALYLMGAIDRARAELEAALATAQRTDAEELKFVYDSKAPWRSTGGS
jgi:hypothetical protein